MSFIKKTWLARIGVGLNRFRMNNSSDVVLESNPISVTQQGDQLSADNMNNLETRIGNAFDEMAGNLAPIEISPASTNHAVGTQIVYNGILYKVTSAISTDDNLVVGTNIEPYPVSSALSDISALASITWNSTYVTTDYRTSVNKVGSVYAVSFAIQLTSVGDTKTIGTINNFSSRYSICDFLAFLSGASQQACPFYVNDNGEIKNNSNSLVGGTYFANFAIPTK